MNLRYRPIYKKFLPLRGNIQNRQKLFKFRKIKWKYLLLNLNRVSLNKTRKNNCYYKFYDQNIYKILKNKTYFSNKYKQTILDKRRFKLFYSYLKKSYLKGLIKKSLKQSDKILNKFSTESIFTSFLENRLDVILVRSHFTLSVRNARQLISHKHVFVNKSVVTDCSYTIMPGDLITFSLKSRSLIEYYLIFAEFWPMPPSNLQISYKLFTIQVLEHSVFSNNSSKFLLWLNLSGVTKSYLK